MPRLPGQKGNSCTIVDETNTSPAPASPTWMPKASSAAQMPAICAAHENVPASIATAVARGCEKSAWPCESPEITCAKRPRALRIAIKRATTTPASTSMKTITSSQISVGRCMTGARATTARASATPRTSCSASAVPAIVEAGMLSPASRLRRASTATRASSPTRANRTELSRKPMKSAGTTCP